MDKYPKEKGHVRAKGQSLSIGSLVRKMHGAASHFLCWNQPKLCFPLVPLMKHFRYMFYSLSLSFYCFG